MGSGAWVGRHHRCSVLAPLPWLQPACPGRAPTTHTNPTHTEQRGAAQSPSLAHQRLHNSPHSLRQEAVGRVGPHTHTYTRPTTPTTLALA